MGTCIQLRSYVSEPSSITPKNRRKGMQSGPPAGKKKGQLVPAASLGRTSTRFSQLTAAFALYKSNNSQKY